jgi:hypothetical protein
VIRLREIPVARLTPRYKPANASTAFIEIRLP